MSQEKQGVAPVVSLSPEAKQTLADIAEGNPAGREALAAMWQASLDAEERNATTPNNERM